MGGSWEKLSPYLGSCEESEDSPWRITGMNADQAAKMIENLQKQGLTRKQIVAMLSNGLPLSVKKLRK